LDFEAVELAARRQSLPLAARALEQRLNTDTSDQVGPQLPCPCGGSAQYHGRHGKTFESVLGPLHLQRAYYHCEQCESGFCPRDRSRQTLTTIQPYIQVFAVRGLGNDSVHYQYLVAYPRIPRPDRSLSDYSLQPTWPYSGYSHRVCG
jgi:hypothetical protein